jgi:hypothetical protein
MKMKKLMIALMLTVIAGAAEAKGSAGIAHATVASHIPAHVSSHQTAQAYVGEPLSNKAQITIAATILGFFVIGITAVIWSGE